MAVETRFGFGVGALKNDKFTVIVLVNMTCIPPPLMKIMARHILRSQGDVACCCFRPGPP